MEGCTWWCSCPYDGRFRTALLVFGDWSASECLDARRAVLTNVIRDEMNECRNNILVEDQNTGYGCHTHLMSRYIHSSLHAYIHSNTYSHVHLLTISSRIHHFVCHSHHIFRPPTQNSCVCSIIHYFITILLVGAS